MHVSGDPNDGTEASQTSRILPRIAEALGVPESAFFGPGSCPDGIEAREQAALLGLVQAYLDSADPGMRRRFVAALRALLDGGRRWV